MEYQIAVIPGDGIGPETTQQAIHVLQKTAEVFDYHLVFEQCLAGTAAVQQVSCPLPEESLELCRRCAAILMGNMHLGLYPHLPLEQRPEYALMCLRRELELQTNLRPASIIAALAELSPLKTSIASRGFDIMTVRDISGGIIMSKNYTGIGVGGREAFEKEYYNEAMIRNTVHWAFRSARHRRKKVTSVDKAVVLSSSVLWREVVTEVGKEYPDVHLEHMYADDAAMRIVQNPEQFDVLVTSNLFGDILSDEIAGLTGAPGLLPAASINKSGKGIYEPNQLHIKRDDITGKNIANPVGLILSGALLLSFCLGLEQGAHAIRRAVTEVLQEGYVTKDIALPGTKSVGTVEMGNRIAERIRT